MNYTIKPGIAALCYVNDQSFIYLSKGKLPVTSPKDDSRHFEALPLAVREAVNKHFSEVFTLPVEARGPYLQAFVPFTIECCDMCGSPAGNAPGYDGNPRCLNCGAY